MTPTRIDICIPTYRRPTLLGQLFESLRAQDLPAGLETAWIVVDNDPEESARPVVEAAAARGWPVRYFTQPEKNIALTRNKALDAATADYIAFLDDDEVATPQWLRHLYATLQACDADVVLGPVQGVLPPDTPAWIQASGAFERPGRPTGTPMSQGAAGNALLRAQALRDRQARFDPAFGLTGGEDTAFFVKLKAQGARLVWCQEALATETVVPDRLSARWILKREFSTGQTYADIVGRPRQALRVPGWMLYRLSLVGVAAVLALACWPWSRGKALRWARKMAANLGQLSSLQATRLKAYAQVTPTR
jgi:succinoglycan biosynthesis protein ExoM